MAESTTILKHPALDTAMDYSVLRQKGLEYIQHLGSKFWTDYNIHDPGITLLELLCYGLTDLGHRTSFDIKDLLAAPAKQTFDHKRQGFFTAREILTINPWTIRDFRKLLVDIDGIKNGWLHVKECACSDIILYANCAKSELQYEIPEDEHPVIIKGLYDVLVEFEDEEGMGNLNSGKVFYNFSYTKKDTSDYTTALIELRLPSWQKLEEHIATYKDLRSENSIVKAVAVSFVSGNKSDDQNVSEQEFPNVLRRPVYVTVSVDFLKDKNNPASTASILFEDIPMKVWFKSDADRKALTHDGLFQAIEDASVSGLFGKYFALVHKADAIIEETKLQLHSHRNLCEDYCSIKAVSAEDIAICADIEVEPSADIEAILAEAYYQIDQYLSPDIKFYSLQELLDSNTPVEDIFNGPALNNGFINNQQIDNTNLKKVLYTSDIINLLMDIPGVISVKNFLFTKYDDEGNQSGNSESWEMLVGFQRQPRFYPEASKFLVFKNGLTFLPDKTELRDILQVIKGKNLQPKFALLENDLAVTNGEYNDLQQYYPLQYQLPLNYGVSYDGLPGTASAERIAQTRQLKAYLMFFEQLFVNYLSQLSSVKDMFAIDDSVTQTYYSNYIGNEVIKNIETEVYEGLTPEALQQLIETPAQFLNRRNRFLDHMLARFAESFNEYALMLYTHIGNKAVTDERLINDKIDFLKDIPVMSHDRGKAFNYKEAGSCSADTTNVAGLKKRIQRLLGMNNFYDYFELYEETDTDNVSYERRWRLVDEKGKIYLSGSTRYKDQDFEVANNKARKEINEVKKYIANPVFYEIKHEKKWVLNLRDDTGETIATRKQAFTTKAAAEAARDELIAFAKTKLSGEKIFLVEHLLLRPRAVPEDHLLGICIPADCSACGEEDPYSFRLTIVLSGESGLANSGIEMRHFAERTIRQEVPAHLAAKICWVSNEQLYEFEEKYCAWLKELAKEEPVAADLTAALNALLAVFKMLKNVYPPASLHDCEDGNDENRVYLNQTIITSLPPKK